MKEKIQWFQNKHLSLLEATRAKTRLTKAICLFWNCRSFSFTVCIGEWKSAGTSKQIIFSQYRHSYIVLAYGRKSHNTAQVCYRYNFLNILSYLCFNNFVNSSNMSIKTHFCLSDPSFSSFLCSALLLPCSALPLHSGQRGVTKPFVALESWKLLDFLIFWYFLVEKGLHWKNLGKHAHAI